MKIFLIGYRCTGKSTIGRILASMLGFSFLDTDKIIETRQSQTISLFVEKNGWDDFRKIEKQILMETAHVKNYVVATGGGIILDPENLQFMKDNGTIIWLKAPAQIIINRMRDDVSSSDLRPSLTGLTIEAETESVLNQRIPLYKKNADFEIDTSVHDVYGTAQKIKRRLDHGW